MARKAETREIDGVEFTVTQLPTMRALQLQARLAGIFGPALGKLAEMIPASSKLEDIDLSALGGAFQLLAEKATPAEFTTIVRELTDGMVFIMPDWEQRLPRSFAKAADDALAGQTLTVYKALGFAFEVNFGDFFDVARGWFARAAAKKKPAA